MSLDSTSFLLILEKRNPNQRKASAALNKDHQNFKAGLNLLVMSFIRQTNKQTNKQNQTQNPKKIKPKKPQPTEQKNPTENFSKNPV